MVYLIQVGQKGPVKIGHVRGRAEVDRLLRAINTYCPDKPELLATLTGADEAYARALHRRLKPHRVRGDWFRREGEVEALIAAAETESLPLDPARRALERANERYLKACGTLLPDATLA